MLDELTKVRISRAVEAGARRVINRMAPGEAHALLKEFAAERAAIQGEGEDDATF